MQRWHVLLDGTSLPGRDEIGGKAWSLARMCQLGLPVPPAFVLPTRVCHAYAATGKTLPAQAIEALHAGIGYLEGQTGRTFGAGPRPLLLSVRSGAPVSMPGMMDTVLNLGMNDTVEGALGAEAADPGYACDTHARFITSYGRIVLKGDLDDAAGTPEQLRALAAEETGAVVPDDPWEQLAAAVAAVFASWQSARAKAYRRHCGISESLGTAVTVQAMAFGNLDDRSGTGVFFTRDPLTGAPEPYGEYLPRGQGEEVVSGERTPLPLNHLAAQLPEVHAQLLAAGRTLEADGRDVQDVEFTVEQGRLYLLQARTAKRSPKAAVQLAVALADDGVISEREAVGRVTADQVRGVLRPRLMDEDRAGATVIATGEPACPGTAAGLAVRDPDEAVERAERGEAVVFVATTTSPEDVHAMIAAAAVCTETGGSTSHAAVVCRGLGRPAVVGCGTGSVAALSGQQITVDGESGQVFAGALPLRTVATEDDEALRRLTRWAEAACPVTVVPPDGTSYVDLDALQVLEPAEVAAAVQGAQAARGSVLDSGAGIAAAVGAGLRIIVTEHPLPVLLAACAAEAGAGIRA
ncbi:MAG: Pyruvate, phosphate dikinase [Frankiales bacterium]|jgi:pyruvate,orthophosphate dikinase|nr:Pyruvate, phosphate dikinase [Frankiales bacterium]